MDTTENNKKLAEFIGGKLKGETNINLKPNEIWLPVFGVCNLDNNGKKLKFDSDWNWLMLVVEKIYSLDTYYDKYIDYNSSMFSSGEIELSTNIKHVYNACVEFVEWLGKEQEASS